MSSKLLLSFDEAAQRVGLSRRTLYRKIDAGTFPRPRRLHGRRVGFHTADVEEWAASLPVTDRKPPVAS